MDGKRIRVHIRDTAGQETFRGMTSSFYRNIHGIFLVYAVTDVASFFALDQWLTDISYHLGGVSGTARIILGNKTDLDGNRVVETTAATAFCCDKANTPFFETSAKSGAGVAEAFQRLVREMLRLRAATPASDDDAAAAGTGHVALTQNSSPRGQDATTDTARKKKRCVLL